MDMSRRLISRTNIAGILLVLSFATPGSAAVVKTHISKKNALSKAQREARLHHAKELFGSRYKRSIAMTGEEIPKINGEVYRLIKDRLPKKFKDQYQAIAQTIIDESLKNQFDPVFLMSVIEGESSWRPDMVGGVGEIGLMQIRPSTAEWIQKRQGLKWAGAKTLLDPATNIRVGAAYLKYLRDHYDMHAQLYLAAYNMGQGNVATALDKNIWPKDYPIHVMKRYVEMYETMAESLAEKRKLTKTSKG